jgi:hypothetical protein
LENFQPRDGGCELLSMEYAACNQAENPIEHRIFSQTAVAARPAPLRVFESGRFLLLMNGDEECPLYIHCPDARSKYGGKGVAFGYEADGEIKSLRGTLICHGHGQKAWVDIEYLGSLYLLPLASISPNNLGYLIHLTQQHYDSIIALPAPDSEVAYMIQLPFLARHCIRKPFAR